MSSYCLVTFGCRVNQADSLACERDLRAAGLQPAPPHAADVVIVNTCSVTSSADQGARQAIRRLARDNPAARIVATGCYATRCAAEVAELPGVVTVVPNGEKEALAARVLPLVAEAADRARDGDGPCGAAIQPGIAGRTAWTLRVQTGCEQACSYCIIPSTRGRSRSRDLADIGAELEAVAAAGFREVAITGVHLGGWGRDLDPPLALPDLLEALARHSSDLLFRVSSLEPMDCTPGVRALLLGEPRFAPHFHLPLQHASGRLLVAMRRPYTLAYYDALLRSVRESLPHASIGTDVLVGFPGETDEDHAANVGWLERSPLTHLHVFPYSDRPGTVAAGLPGKVHGAVVRARAEEVRRVGARLTAAFRQAMDGTIRPGLTLEDGTLVVTDNYLKVRIPPGLPRNVRVRVRVATCADSMSGVVMSGE
jgi:threonylcarbamoyladenosine tRNA methylthiotransferase MtaB